MRPNTPHYVLTVQNAINLGHHFYCRSTLDDHSWGLIHTGIVEGAITNAVHPELYPFLLRMLDRSIQDYLDIASGTCSIQGESRCIDKVCYSLATDIIIDPHRINPLDWEGLLNLVHFGNVVELSHLWDPGWYRQDGLSLLHKTQVAHIHQRYLEFQQLFSQRQRLKNGDVLVDPSKAFFEPSILQLAVAIYKYKQAMKTFDNRFTVKELHTGLEKHFEKNRPELLAEFRQEIKKDVESLAYCQSFRWQGVVYKVVEASQKHVLSRGKFFLVLFFS